MNRLFTLVFLALPFCVDAQISPANLGTTNLTTWFRADDLLTGTSVTSWYPVHSILSGSYLEPVNAAGPYPDASAAHPNQYFNYNNFVDFTGSSNAAPKGLMYNYTGTLNLLNNNTASGQELYL